jgi:DUF438 domain-containing protein
MTITPKTTVQTLTKEYPFLLAFLAAYNPEFKRLTNPVLRQTMGRMATLERAAGLGNVPLNALMIDIAGEIERVTGERPMIADMPGTNYVDPARQDALKAIIRDLHNGHPMDELKQRFAAVIDDVDAAEIATMEQQLIEEGLSEQEVKRLCDVHVQVFADSLEEHEKVSTPAGHPIDTFQRENEALLQVTTSLRKVADAVGDPVDDAVWQRLEAGFHAAAERFYEVEKHYLRKENQLFPFLERHGVVGPTKVMWALHDDMRALMKELRTALANGDVAGAVSAARQLATISDDMVYKEEKVLFPLAMEVLTDAEWTAIRAGEASIGYALVAAPPAWPPVSSGAPGQSQGKSGEASSTVAGDIAVASAAPSNENAAREGADLLALNVGALSVGQLRLLLAALPLDYSFVDEHDTVLFYSEGDRIFPRSPGVIGRQVQNCHPPASVYKVQQIIDSFRAGEKDVAEFWLTINERFLHIRYFACRDDAGVYRGVVETVQDVTEIRALTGQRRLLDW